MKIPTLSELDAFSQVDIKTFDPAQLMDIREVAVDKNLQKEERIIDFIRQVHNPYCFRHGKVVVKISFSESADDTTLEEQFESYLRSL